jgi:hypothetical protein
MCACMWCIMCIPYFSFFVLLAVVAVLIEHSVCRACFRQIWRLAGAAPKWTMILLITRQRIRRWSQGQRWKFCGLCELSLLWHIYITWVNNVSNVSVLYGHWKYSISYSILLLQFIIEIILILSASFYLFAAAVYKSAEWVYCFHGVKPCSLVICYRPFGSSNLLETRRCTTRIIAKRNRLQPTKHDVWETSCRLADHSTIPCNKSSKNYT